MPEEYELTDWIKLTNSRGIAGFGASDTDEQKSIVERSQMCEFADTISHLKSIEFWDITAAPPPLPDFKCQVGDQTLHVELIEFIDPELVQMAKHILATPSHELHETAKKYGVTFDPSSDWFKKILDKTITKKDSRYRDRSTKIDVLLIYNEAVELNENDIGKWLESFEIPSLAGISSVYFKNWRVRCLQRL